jgi:hypothetical protein
MSSFGDTAPAEACKNHGLQPAWAEDHYKTVFGGRGRPEILIVTIPRSGASRVNNSPSFSHLFIFGIFG